MNNWNLILKKLGKQVDIAFNLGVNKTNICRWIQDNHVPPRHFLKLQKMCHEKDIFIDIEYMYELNKKECEVDKGYNLTIQIDNLNDEIEALQREKDKPKGNK